jgi:hypothetical protein
MKAVHQTEFWEADRTRKSATKGKLTKERDCKEEKQYCRTAEANVTVACNSSSKQVVASN